VGTTRSPRLNRMEKMTAGYAHSRLIARLRAIALLSDEDADLIASLPVKLENIPGDHDIVREGDVSDRCCLLVDGYLIRHKIEAQGKRQIVSFHVAGDVPDLYSLHLRPMDHNVTSLGPAVVGFIQHAAMLDALARSFTLTSLLWRETLVDAALFREWVVNLGKRDAMARIAHLLCELLARLRAVGLARDGRFTFPASQLDVADATGMTAVHANRMIQQLRSQELVQWDGADVTIPDPGRLQHVAGFDDRYLHHR
jgi:CRP-like cAMP-binding protein